jgi:signal transduction histidine kinase
MNTDLAKHVSEVQAISAVPQILDTVAAITGLGFVAIAHVTADSWTTCAVRDALGFGLKVGGQLDVTTTLCDEVRSAGKAIVIDNVAESTQYRHHHTPRIYGFQSYFSIPVYRRDGTYFGTLCGLDRKAVTLSEPATISTLELFAKLISAQLESERVHEAARTDLRSERDIAALREKFIGVLGHDLRTPLTAMQYGVELLKLKHPEEGTRRTLGRMERSIGRMGAMVDDVVDFTRGRMGGGIALALRTEPDVASLLAHVIDEMRDSHPTTQILSQVQAGIALTCDIGRLGQLLSNLLKNAIVHGTAGVPVQAWIAADERVFTMSVSNAGPALAPHVVERLFEPFWRSPSASVHEGLGLGLFIVSEVARSHGGKLEVTSTGDNVTFTFSMPIEFRGN